VEYTPKDQRSNRKLYWDSWKPRVSSWNWTVVWTGICAHCSHRRYSHNKWIINMIKINSIHCTGDLPDIVILWYTGWFRNRNPWQIPTPIPQSESVSMEVVVSGTVDVKASIRIRITLSGIGIAHCLESKQLKKCKENTYKINKVIREEKLGNLW